MRTPYRITLLSIVILLAAVLARAGTAFVTPAPDGEPLSADYTVRAEGKPVPVYECKVAAAEKVRRWKAMDDKTNSATYFDKASFCYVDAEGQIEFEVRTPLP